MRRVKSHPHQARDGGCDTAAANVGSDRADLRQQGDAALKKAAICVRVSTTNRTHRGDGFEQNPEVQEVPLRQLAQQRGWTLVRVYSDRLTHLPTG
jgi:hypothetical protein